MTFAVLAAMFVCYVALEYATNPAQQYFVYKQFGLNINLAISPWSSITSVFIHGNWSHLFGNMFMIGIAGIIVEPELRTRRMVAACLMALAVSDLTEMIFIDSDVRVLGSSGLAYGILGLIVTHRTKISDIVLWLILGFLLWDMIPDILAIDETNVAVMSHIGGFVGGCLAGLVYSFMNKNRSRYKIASRMVLPNTSSYRETLSVIYRKTEKISAAAVLYSGLAIYLAAIVVSAARAS